MNEAKKREAVQRLLALIVGFRVIQNETGLILELSHSLNENQPMHPEKRTS